MHIVIFLTRKLILVQHMVIMGIGSYLSYEYWFISYKDM